MEKKSNIDYKQKIIDKKKEWNYIYKNVILPRIVPLLIILIAIEEAFYKTYEKSHNVFIILVIIKICLGLMVGILVGKYEWKFNQKLLSGYYTSIKKIRNEYVCINGILSWGLIIGISYIKYPFDSILISIFNIFIWLLFGLLFGLFSWKSASKKYEKFITSAKG